MITGWLSRRPAVVVAGLMGVHALLVAAAFDPTIFTGGDNGVYVALSRSLLERHAYLSIYDPVAYPHTLYPPGYPVILALGALLGLHPWVPIKLITVAFSIAGVALCYLYVRRRSSEGVAAFAALGVAVAPGLLALSHTELSDVPFWAMVMLGLWALEDMPPESHRRAAIGGVAMAAAYLTRTAAVPIIVAVLVWMAVGRRWRQTAVFCALVLPAMGWWYWWTHTSEAGSVYVNQFWYLDPYQPELGRATMVDVLARIPENVVRYGANMVPLMFRADRGHLIFGLTFMALATLGWAARARTLGLGEVLLPLYAAMLLLVPPAWAGERYMLPILPLALAYAAEGALHPVRRWAPRWTATLGAVGAVGFLSLTIPANAERVEAASACRRVYTREEPYACLVLQWQEYLTMADWSRDGLPADAIVVSRKPGLFFSLSDRRGVDIPKTSRGEEFFRIVEEAGARYIVLDQVDFLTPMYAVPTAVRYVGSFCLVRASPTENTLLLGILPGPHVPEPEDAMPALGDCPPEYLADRAR